MIKYLIFQQLNLGRTCTCCISTKYKNLVAAELILSLRLIAMLGAVWYVKGIDCYWWYLLVLLH